ncbi:MAG: hypothetical protein ICV83_25575 [Cytophagales bacterium]|nr:hypothetical protein [Cytophagales bacterium]
MKPQNNSLSRRNLMASSGLLTAGLLFSPRHLLEETSPVTTIINEAAKSPVTVQKLRNNISVLEGSGGNIITFTGREGKLMVDAGIEAGPIPPGGGCRQAYQSLRREVGQVRHQRRLLYQPGVPQRVKSTTHYKRRMTKCGQPGSQSQYCTL